MKDCLFCLKPIETRIKAASIVGGLFPAEDPEFFMVELTVMKECYIHLDCLKGAFSRHRGDSQPED